MYKIPLFNLNYDHREEQAAVNTIKSKWVSTGPKCKEFERLFSEQLGTDYCLTTSSCTSALHLALIVLGIKKNDEVIVPSLTFSATVNAIKYLGATPIFADVISRENFTIDSKDISKKITDKTKAIIVMHYGGFPCEMKEIRKIAKVNKLKIVEDTAHAPLSEFNRQKLGTIGDIGCFSFFSNKNISIGEGGMLITNDTNYYEKALLLRSHGMTTESFERSKGHSTNYDIKKLGYNYRMDDIRASIGIVQFQKLKKDLDKRIKIRQWYLQELENIESITVPFKHNIHFVSNYIMPILVDDSNSLRREAVRNNLHRLGIQTSVHYPAVHRFSVYNDLETNLPNTEYISDNEITLPMYSELKKEEVLYICNTLKGIVKTL